MNNLLKKITRFFILALFGLTSLNSFADKPTLTIYTYDSFAGEWGPGPKLKAEFEKLYDSNINIIAFDSALTMFNRLRLEGKKTKADLIIGIDIHSLDTAEESQLFAPHNVDLNKLNLPIKWKNKTFLPYDYGHYAFIYDKNLLKNPPTSLKELVANQKLKVIYQDPRTSSVGRGLLTWLNNVYPANETEQAWNTLAKHTVTVGKGWSSTYGAFLKGEADMVLSYTTSPIYHLLNENKDNYAAAQFTEGHIMQIELAAKLSSTTQPELSDKFLDFLLSDQAQKTIALSNVMMPATNLYINPEYELLKTTKTLEIKEPDAKTFKNWINIWQNALSK